MQTVGWGERATLTVGEIVGGYRVVAPIGEDRRGIVYRAEHVAHGTRAALRVPHDGLARPRAVERWFADARHVAPGVVHTIAVGHGSDGRPFQLTELLEGRSLAELLHNGRHLDVALALSIGCQLATALDALHTGGVVHADLRAESVVVVGGRATIVDVGVSHLDARPRARGPRGDLYAIGRLLYEMLGADAALAHGSLREIVTQLIAWDPARAPGSAARVASELARIADGLATATADQTLKLRIGFPRSGLILGSAMLCLCGLAAAALVAHS